MTAKKQKTRSFGVPADLSSGAAREVIRELAQRLDRVPKTLTVELTGQTDEVSISAIQLLVSLRNTRSDTAIRLGKQASQAIDTFIGDTTAGNQS